MVDTCPAKYVMGLFEGDAKAAVDSNASIMSDSPTRTPSGSRRSSSSCGSTMASRPSSATIGERRTLSDAGRSLSMGTLSVRPSTSCGKGCQSRKWPDTPTNYCGVGGGSQQKHLEKRHEGQWRPRTAIEPDRAGFSEELHALLTGGDDGGPKKGFSEDVLEFRRSLEETRKRRLHIELLHDPDCRSSFAESGLLPPRTARIKPNGVEMKTRPALPCLLTEILSDIDGQSRRSKI